MPLKAILFDFNGVIINDEPIHAQLIEQILLAENLRLNPGEFQTFCLGRSDRACLTDLLSQRGRAVTDLYLDTLIRHKATAYQQALAQLDALPIYSDLTAFLTQLKSRPYKLAVVSGALKSEIEFVLQQIQALEQFQVIVAGEDITGSKPQPDGYLLAVERLNQIFPDLDLHPHHCLAIEDTFAGIAAAKAASIPVVGIAHTYPFHMMQRWANWAVDYLTDLELDRIQSLYDQQDIGSMV
jgi:HAD superfamily hydrolase (TIGR01509 family)